MSLVFCLNQQWKIIKEEPEDKHGIIQVTEVGVVIEVASEEEAEAPETPNIPTKKNRRNNQNKP